MTKRQERSGNVTPIGIQPIRVWRPVFGTGKLEPHERDPVTGQWHWVEYVDREQNKLLIRDMTPKEERELRKELKRTGRWINWSKRPKKKNKKQKKLKHAA